MSFTVLSLTVIGDDQVASLRGDDEVALLIHHCLVHKYSEYARDDDDHIKKGNLVDHNEYGNGEIYVKQGTFTTLQDANMAMSLINDPRSYRPSIISYAILSTDLSLINLECSECTDEDEDESESEDDNDKMSD